MICRSSPCVITTIAPFHFGSAFFFLSPSFLLSFTQLSYFFRSWSFYFNLVLGWLKTKYLAQIYAEICKFWNSMNCMRTNFNSRSKSLRFKFVSYLFSVKSWLSPSLLIQQFKFKIKNKKKIHSKEIMNYGSIT